MPFSNIGWQRQFEQLFAEHYRRLFRYLDRLSGDPDLAADLAQEALVALYRRGQAPDQPGAWLITVAMNRLRNTRSTEQRRRRLLVGSRAEAAHADPAPAPDGRVTAEDGQARVRAALAQLDPRERKMLLLRAEGYSYDEIATALEMKFTSVGTTLARARKAFQEHYGA